MSNESVEAVGRSLDHSVETEGCGENSSGDQRISRDEDDLPESASQRQASRVSFGRLARNHALVFLVAIVSFAAADTWSTVSGLLIAEILCVTIAALAGLAIATLVHEWFHYWGARVARAHVKMPTRQGLFLYVWDFSRNSTGQFLIMSVAGTIGSFLAVAVVWSTVPADTLGRAVLRSAAVASVIYSAMIEWPVIRRCRVSGDPLGELSKIDKALLTRSFFVASLSGIALTILLMY